MIKSLAGFRVLIIVFSISALITLVLSMVMGPEELFKMLIATPLGLVLVGRLMIAYWLVYPVTGSGFLAFFAAILFNNSMSALTILSAPPVIHMISMRWRTRFGWDGGRRTILLIALMLSTLFGASLMTSISLQGFKRFMLLEAALVLLIAAAVYKSSQQDAGGFRTYYKGLMLRVLPAIAALLVSSALVEAYEVV
jgi:hypothetical protein